MKTGDFRTPSYGTFEIFSALKALSHDVLLVLCDHILEPICTRQKCQRFFFWCGLFGALWVNGLTRPNGLYFLLKPTEETRSSFCWSKRTLDFMTSEDIDRTSYAPVIMLEENEEKSESKENSGDEMSVNISLAREDSWRNARPYVPLTLRLANRTWVLPNPRNWLKKEIVKTFVVVCILISAVFVFSEESETDANGPPRLIGISNDSPRVCSYELDPSMNLRFICPACSCHGRYPTREDHAHHRKGFAVKHLYLCRITRGNQSWK